MSESHAVTIIDPSTGRGLAELDAIEKNAREKHDTIADQLAELVESRDPSRTWSKSDLEAEVRRTLGADPRRFGRWVFFPWSGRLVHLLAPEDFEWLRTSRNRNKITREEQHRLANLTLAIAGLSVGQATALTLALEGVGGTFHLADFDTLALSNMNRLRAGVHEIGVNKAIITARSILEINPYARITVFTDGVTDANIDAFLRGIDMLFEECDDLRMKVLMRERARALRIPVLMETSDRGLFDVERFDHEPDRKLFHGLAGDLKADSLRGLTTYEKVPIVLALVGASTMSARMAASLVDIDATIKTWPQLASGVALGGAINTDVARRVALGQLRRSGRFFVDLEEIVSDERAEQIHTPVTTPAIAPEQATVSGAVAEPFVDAIVRAASLAPSGGNCQPWRFRFSRAENVIECWHDEDRSRSFLDYEHRASYLALGAAMENLRLACTSMQRSVRFVWFPNSESPRLFARVVLDDSSMEHTPWDAELAGAMELRATNRKLGPRKPLPGDLLGELARVAQHAGATWAHLETAEQVHDLAEVIARAEKVRMLHPVMHKEMMGEIRWSSAEAARTRDGLDVATLELSATDLSGLNLLRSERIVSMIRTLGVGAGLKKSVHKSFASASAAGLLRWSGADEPRLAFARGGRALQRVWLLANARGVALQPMTAFLYLLMRLRERPNDYEGRDRADLEDVGRDLVRLFPDAARSGSTASWDLMLFRLAVVDAPTARALRRPLSDILSVT